MGAVVGGLVGGVAGGVAGILGVESNASALPDRHVVERHVPSYRYDEDVRVGTVLPEAGVEYYDVPPEYGVREYRHTVVLVHTVLRSKPGETRRIVEVVE